MVITRPWTKLISMFEDETCTLLVHILGFGSKHSSMDFIVHGLDVHYDTRLCILSSIVWTCIMLYFAHYIDEYALGSACSSYRLYLVL